MTNSKSGQSSQRRTASSKCPISVVYALGSFCISLLVRSSVIVGLLVVALLLVNPRLAPAQVDSGNISVYVSPQGNDEWSGRLSAPTANRTDGPLATLHAARDAIRQLKEKGQFTEPVVVFLRGGTYYLSESLVLTQQDSGTADCPITYRAYPGETPVLSGGQPIRGWQPFRDGIYQANLGTQGLADVSFYQLFYQGERQHLARYPNFDPQRPRSGGWLYTQGPGPERGEQFFYSEGDIPFGEWKDISQAEVFTHYARGWSFGITPIREVDTSRRLITVRRIRWSFWPKNRYFIRNVFGALDAPGEWFLNRKTNMLYFYAPDGRPDDDVVVPVLDHLIVIEGSIPYPHAYLQEHFEGTRDDCPLPDDAPPDDPVTHVNFEGLHLQEARQDAIRFIGARECAVTRCVITNIGAVGVNLGGGVPRFSEIGNPRQTPDRGTWIGLGGAGQDLLVQDPCEDCRVAGNDIWSVGSDGITLFGTANLAENNHIYDTGLYDKDSCCITAWGEENVISRNELHDIPRIAITFKGVDNIVELNSIYNTMLETQDGGGIRMCQRNFDIRGNIIRFNKIVDTIGYGYVERKQEYASPRYCWGIYLDDFTCGTTVFGNTVVRTGRGGLHIHGGSDNIVENNIFIEGKEYQFESSPIAPAEPTGNICRRNIFVYDGSKSILHRTGQWNDDQVRWENNLVWPQGGSVQVRLRSKVSADSWDEWLAADLASGSVLARPGFVDPEAGDYRLQKDSPAWPLGFVPIPYDRIGCYQSAERASWPLEVAPDLVGEQLLNTAFGPDMVDEDFEGREVGRQPLRGDILTSGQASIQVSDEFAASGQCSLKFTDAAELDYTWEPRIFYVVGFDQGTIQFSYDIRIDGQQPAELVTELREEATTGGLAGPLIKVNRNGELRTGDDVLMKVPFDQWIHVNIVLDLGPDAPGTSQLTVTVPDQQPRSFTVPNLTKAFSRLDLVVIYCTGSGAGVCYLDNIRCALQ